jgi:hypothetical protein
MKDQPSARRGRVDPLAQAAKPDPTLLQLAIVSIRMPQRAAQPVKPPHDQRVLPVAQMIQHPSQLRPVAQRAAGGIAEDPLRARGGQRVELQREILLARRDPRIPE